MRYDPSRSILAGLDRSILEQRLQQMQLDYLDLVAGRKIQSANYAQGDGAKSVTYSTADIPALQQAIRQLQAQLGLISAPRRAIGVRFA
jgi:hypothetical protein